MAFDLSGRGEGERKLGPRGADILLLLYFLEVHDLKIFLKMGWICRYALSKNSPKCLAGVGLPAHSHWRVMRVLDAPSQLGPLQHLVAGRVGQRVVVVLLSLFL